MHPLQPQAGQVDVGDEQPRLVGKPLRCRQLIAELVDQALPVPGHVVGALTRSRGAEDVGAGRAQGLRRAQQRPVTGLPHHDVGGRQVCQDQRPGQRCGGGGRGGRPEVLADLHADDRVVDVGGAEQQVGAEGHPFARRLDLQARDAGAGGEPALLVVLAVVGQERLRDHAEHSAAMDGYRAVVQPTAAQQRGADQQEGA